MKIGYGVNKRDSQQTKWLVKYRLKLDHTLLFYQFELYSIDLCD